VRAILRAVPRSKRVRVDGKAQTHRWIEPQLDVPETMDTLMSIGPGSLPAAGMAALVDRRERVARPALPPGPEPPKETAFAAITSAPVRATMGGEAGAPSSVCTGFDRALGRCERETRHPGNHRNRDHETWA
jgi:hypothetical protein